ncbi:hypothetical protein VIAQ111709_16335 [Vibrio aquimaris]|uniref:Uncharacterized protein n=1 Tax=Vibrio aquimaris TaxID=2587862 RepID=A0A5P9CS10_9VIBR|nr:hypothetical protein FIV01_19595 [Vibrio aquimaris]
MSNNGYEFGLVLLAASASLAVSGAGNMALDNPIVRRLSQPSSLWIIKYPRHILRGFFKLSRRA